MTEGFNGIRNIDVVSFEMHNKFVCYTFIMSLVSIFNLIEFNQNHKEKLRESFVYTDFLGKALIHILYSITSTPYVLSSSNQNVDK